MATAFRDRIKALKRIRASELRRNPKNWRTHPDAQRSALAGVLAEIGYADALIAREVDDGYELIDGHLRLDISPNQKLPVLVLDVDEDEADKLLATLDPLTAMAETNSQALAELLEHVSFNDAAVNDMLAALVAGDVQDEVEADEAPEVEDPSRLYDDVDALVEKWKPSPGQLWIIPSRNAAGDHRILCGDSRDASSWDQVLAGAKADLCVTSPPYNVGIDYPGYKDSMKRDEFLSFLASIARALLDALAPGRFVAWNTGVSPDSHPHWQVVTLEQVGFDFVREIAWVKSGTCQFQFHHSLRVRRARHYTPNYQHELVYLFETPGEAPSIECPTCRGKAAISREDIPFVAEHETLNLLVKGSPELGDENDPNPRYCSDVWRINQSGSGKDLPTIGHRSNPRSAEDRKKGRKAWRPVRVHPAVFPVEVPAAAMSVLTSRGERVIDPFGGTATTIVAAEKKGRLGSIVEQAPLYVAVALERLSKMGLSPRLAGAAGKKGRRKRA